MILPLLEDIKKQEDFILLHQSGLPLEGIKLERELLEELKGRAQLIYNTSQMKPRELREKIINGIFSK